MKLSDKDLPAYPAKAMIEKGKLVAFKSGIVLSFPGMTKREETASKMLASMLSNPSILSGYRRNIDWDEYAEAAINAADALLRKLGEHNED